LRILNSMKSRPGTGIGGLTHHDKSRARRLFTMNRARDSRRAH
jgi:hypothetical protein